MAQHKYFAIRYKSGKTEILYDKWDNIQHKVIGVSGVTFKGFDFEKHAQEWLGQAPIPYRTIKDEYKPDRLYIFVDGSFSASRNQAGWGWVAIQNDQVVAEACGTVPGNLDSRNICGELEAAMEAVRGCLAYMKRFPVKEKPIIVHDYIGIGNWACGYWEANRPVAVKYQNFMASRADKFEFEKVSGHKGIKWNEYADQLTKEGYTNARSVMNHEADI
jgi:ribonuclease H-related protein